MRKEPGCFLAAGKLSQLASLLLVTLLVIGGCSFSPAASEDDEATATTPVSFRSEQSAGPDSDDSRPDETSPSPHDLESVQDEDFEDFWYVDSDERPLMDLRYHGSEIDWLYDGTLYLVGYYRYAADGQQARDGLWLWRWGNGQARKKEPYSNGQLDGVVEEWSDAGVRILRKRYVAGVPDGVHRHWHPCGSTKQDELFVDGLRHGPLRQWYPCGGIKLEDSYLDGLRHGPLRQWHPDGVLWHEAFFERGVQIGRESFWYPNGRLMAWTTYEDDRLSGPWRHWSESGQLIASGAWLEGSKHGVWHEWDDEGRLMSKVTYAHGQVLD